MVKKVESLRLERAKATVKAKVNHRDQIAKPEAKGRAEMGRIKEALERHRETNGKAARVKELVESRKRGRKKPA